MSSILKVDQLQDSGGNAIITSNGSGTITPNFNNAGGLVLLNTQTTTDTTTTNIDFDSTYITSNYTNYVVYANVKPADDNRQLRIRFFVDGSIKSGASDYGVGTIDEGGGGTNDNDLNYLLGSQVSVGNATGEGVAGNFIFSNLTSNTSPSAMSLNSNSLNSSNAHSMIVGGGVANYDSVNDGIRFFFSTGNFASGSTISLYGVKS